MCELERFGKQSVQYSMAIRTFAFTLRYYSPRAYDYVRNKFGRHLPDDSTIRAWVSNCTGFSVPGISAEALRALKSLSNEKKTNQNEFYCSLSFDEMYIRRNVTWSDAQKKFRIDFIWSNER